MKLLSREVENTTGSIPFTLDGPTQVTVSLQRGGMAPQCARFVGLMTIEQPGVLKAERAPGTLACR